MACTIILRVAHLRDLWNKMFYFHELYAPNPTRMAVRGSFVTDPPQPQRKSRPVQLTAWTPCQVTRQHLDRNAYAVFIPHKRLITHPYPPYVEYPSHGIQLVPVAGAFDIRLSDELYEETDADTAVTSRMIETRFSTPDDLLSIRDAYATLFRVAPHQVEIDIKGVGDPYQLLSWHQTRLVNRPNPRDIRGGLMPWTLMVQTTTGWRSFIPRERCDARVWQHDEIVQR